MKILCLHGAGLNSSHFKDNLAYLIPLLPNYTFEFIDGPFDDTDNLENEVQDPKYWLDFNRIHYKPPVTDAVLEVAFRSVRKVWDSSYVGIIGFSQGAWTALYSADQLNPPPKFCVFFSPTVQHNVAFTDHLTKTLSSWNGKYLEIQGNQDEEESIISRFLGTNDLIVHQEGHIVPKDTALMSKIATWVKQLDEHELSPWIPVNHSWTILPNHTTNAINGVVSISLKVLETSNSISMYHYESFIKYASVTALRTASDFADVATWPKSQTTHRSTQMVNSTVYNENQLTLVFAHAIPAGSQIILHLEFVSNSILATPYFNGISTHEVTILSKQKLNVESVLQEKEVMYGNDAYNAYKISGGSANGSIFTLPCSKLATSALEP
ncbi:serine hydrolase-domain-containing protein [Globomyces pollinis-pini]|nr:serine hydrolase-domain-containing protein [Globomyces pollinis-pini]